MPTPSPELARIIGEGETTPEAAVTALWNYVTSRGLGESGQETFKLDDNLRAVFGAGVSVSFRDAVRHLGRHLGLSQAHAKLVKLRLEADDGTVETPWPEPLGGRQRNWSWRPKRASATR